MYAVYASITGCVAPSARHEPRVAVASLPLRGPRISDQ